jgi:hypothetical protein
LRERVAGQRHLHLILLFTGAILGARTVYVIYITLDVIRFSIFISGEFHRRYPVEGTVNTGDGFKAELPTTTSQF